MGGRLGYANLQRRRLTKPSTTANLPPSTHPTPQHTTTPRTSPRSRAPPRKADAAWPKSSSRPSSTRRPAESGASSAISTACRTGRRSSPRAASSRTQRADQVGCIRNFRLKDGGVHPRAAAGALRLRFLMTYSILESPMGVENYVATLTLTPVTDGDRTFAEWRPSSTARRSARRSSSSISAATSSWRAFTRSSRASGAERHGAGPRGARSSTRRSTRSGGSCATSTATTAGIRPSPRAASKAAAARCGRRGGAFRLADGGGCASS